MVLIDKKKFVNQGQERITYPTLFFTKNKQQEEKLLEDGSRIVFILASYPLVEKCINAAILNKGETRNLSDHYPMECEYDFT